MANAPSKNVKSVNRWTPNPAPVNNDQLSDYLFHELNRLSDIIFNLDVFRLEPTNVDPKDQGGNDKGKPRNGDIRYAAWARYVRNPGGNTLGANGIYCLY